MEANLSPERFGTYDSDAAGNTTITFIRQLDHEIDKVWRAITIPEHRAAWFAELNLDLELGGQAVVNFSGGDCPPPEDNPSDVYYCKVIQLDPPNLLEYQGAGEHHRFELKATEDGCELTFMALVPVKTQYDDNKQTIISRYSVSCGWHYKLDQMEWDMAGLHFEDEGYAGPIKTKYYLEYLKRDKK